MRINLRAVNDACIQDFLWSLGLAWAYGKQSPESAQAYELYEATMDSDLSNKAMFQVANWCEPDCNICYGGVW
jgi:hypothetical protein